MRNAFLLIIILLNFRCLNPKKNLEYTICNDSIRYWNYEWAHDRSQYFGFTFSFNENGKVLKYSYRKESNTRRIFEDSHVSGYGNWKVSKDSILTFMDSDFKITSYSENTIYGIQIDSGENVKFISVKNDDLNIVGQ